MIDLLFLSVRRKRITKRCFVFLLERADDTGLVKHYGSCLTVNVQTSLIFVFLKFSIYIMEAIT